MPVYEISDRRFPLGHLLRKGKVTYVVIEVMEIRSGPFRLVNGSAISMKKWKHRLRAASPEESAMVEVMES